MIFISRIAKVIDWQKSGEEFYGVVKEKAGIVEGYVTPEHPAIGAIFSLNHKFELSVDQSFIRCIVQVVQKFRNDNQKPTVNELYKLETDSYEQAVICFNEKIVESGVDIAPFDFPPHPLKEQLISVLQGLITKAYPEN